MKTVHHGHCTCGYVQYNLTAPPLIVHCCHCSWCQRETGTAFATNALIEDHHLHITHGEIETIDTPTRSGSGQKIARCPKCYVALWSHYVRVYKRVSFIRVGTLTEPHRCLPDVHVFTSTKQPWIVLPENIPAYKGIYIRSKTWSPESIQRIELLNATKKINLCLLTKNPMSHSASCGEA